MKDLIASVDAAAFACLSGGEVIVYRSGDGLESTVPGIFETAYQKINAGEPGVTSNSPAVFMRTDDLLSDPEDDTKARVIVDGVEFKIREPQKDGQGGVLLHLHRVP